MLRADTAAMLRDHLQNKAQAAPAFDLPPADCMADVIRADLAAAREAWLNEAKGDPKLWGKRQESHFLHHTDEQGRVFDFHGLRVAFVTNLARAGVALQQAQKLARHSDPKLTANIYTRLGDADHERALAMLPDLDGPDEGHTEAAAATGTDDQSATDALQPEGANRPQVSSSAASEGEGEHWADSLEPMPFQGDTNTEADGLGQENQPPGGLEPPTCCLQNSCSAN